MLKILCILLFLFTFFTLHACDSKPKQRFSVSAGTHTEIPSNTQFHFDARTSTNPELLNIQWTQISGIPVTINNKNTLQADFLSPQVFLDQELIFLISIENQQGHLATDTIHIKIYPITDLSNAEFSFDHLPKINRRFNLSIINNNNFGNLRWKLTQSNSANLNDFLLSKNKKILTFTANTIGHFVIQVTSDMSDVTRKISFYIQEEFPFQVEKVKGYDGSIPINKIIGEITNQSWIRSATLTQNQLTTIIAEYPQLTFLGFDEYRGALVEYDDTDQATEIEMSQLQKRQGIKQIYSRQHEGELSPKIESNVYQTNDYDGWEETPSGDNWQLEKIQAPKAWPFNTGNPDILIGISDGGFDSSHEELKGRVNQQITQTENTTLIDHGNGVAGTIAAIANNKKGIAGINWQSQIFLAGNDYNSILALSNQEKVRVISSSWAIPGYISKTFDASNSKQTRERKEKAIKATRIYRTLAQQNPDKLYIWSSGNGINNGKGFNNVFGIEGEYHSPALHLSNDGNLHYQDNVLFVSAANKNNTLYFYSNYGRLVEIAAPSHFKSLTANDYKNFLGTSAATPVVAGVASLIFSLNPEFTGKEVKDILIKSAIESISTRHPTPTSSQKESIIQLPLVNAYEAMKEASRRLNRKFRIYYAIPNPFIPMVSMKFIPFHQKTSIMEISGNLLTSNEHNWEIQTSFHSYQPTTPIEFTPNLNPKKVISNVHIETSEKEPITIEIETMLNIGQASIDIKNQLTDKPINNVKVSIENLDKDITYSDGRTSNLGQAQLWLKPGRYKLSAQAFGFKPTSTTINIQANTNQEQILSLFPLESEGLCGLDGIVQDLKGNPLPSITLQLSSKRNLVGAYQATTSNKNGFFKFSNIPSVDESGNPINDYQLHAVARGYITLTKAINIVSAVTRTTHVSLSESSNNKLFFEDVETQNNWQMNGLWQRINLEANQTYNKIADGGFTQIPSNYPLPTANLPQASSGKFSFWFGDEKSGSYIHEQAEDDYPASGGTSKATHAGSLISPPINLIDIQHPTLTFKTWWEIESHSPAREQFDRMEIWISSNAGTSYEVLKVLNPYFTNQIIEYADKPFSSAGFDKNPIWINETVDLLAYKNEIIQIKFVFDTNDRFSNGFRGWIIDDISIDNIKK